MDATSLKLQGTGVAMRWEGSMSRFLASNLRMGNPVLTADFS